MDSEAKQVVLVSGGSRGLGRAIVEDFLHGGHIVATFSQTETPFIQEWRARDPQCMQFSWEQLDITDHARVKQFVLSLAKRHGRIDVLVNNAGVGRDGVLALMRSDDIERLLAVNFEAAIKLTQACVRVMLAREAGQIISISSIVSLRGAPGASVYSATKSALDGFSRSLARELGPKGIRVNTVAPGYFESEMVKDFSEEQRRRITDRTPLRRLATLQDIVSAVRFLASPQSSFITGQTLVVDGGYTC